MKPSNIPLASRLIVAADFKGENIFLQLIALAKALKGTGVVLKLNSTLRRYGYKIIGQIKDLGLEVFVDLKLNDIPETLAIDGELLSPYSPDFVTVMASAGTRAINGLVKALPATTEVLGVTVLTSMDEGECQSIYGTASLSGVAQGLGKIAIDAGAGGLICSGHEASMFRGNHPEITINCPGIRPQWATVAGDDQRRVMTPAEAIKAGANRIVIGRPITGAKDSKDAVKRTLSEISSALGES